MIIDGKEYILKDDIEKKYCIVRCHDAGVHAGYVEHWDTQESRIVKVFNSRRLWRWWGGTLSGLAIEGTFAPDKCKFANEVGEILLFDVAELILCTEKSRKSLQGVSPWTNE